MTTEIITALISIILFGGIGVKLLYIYLGGKFYNYRIIYKHGGDYSIQCKSTLYWKWDTRIADIATLHEAHRHLSLIKEFDKKMMSKKEVVHIE